MHRLPAIIDFDASAFPELQDIFHDIDMGIAAIVAADPTLQPRKAHARPKRRAKAPVAAPRRRSGRRAAAA
ncbi:hypothetical protein IC608_04710 [Devosia sp. PTR5]|uniref:Uncharacterized protein n=1 Tax=Devosia oryzisoli TaxID=2774138 RepID=A0A927FR93_9HYPH|nr:hypothetical protein [Devosia oryzisoli]MBD8064775.1 hypothetical protein [Devosia oryzisoli]